MYVHENVDITLKYKLKTLEINKLKKQQKQRIK